MSLPPLTTPTDIADLPHDSSGWVIVLTCTLCLTLAVVLVGLRVYTRHFILRTLWIDDYFAMLSVGFLLAVCVVELVAIKHGLGAHLWDAIANNQLTSYLFYSWLGLLMYNIALLSVKLMYFFQYFHIVRQNKRLRLIYAGIMSVVVIWTTGQILFVILSCNPISVIWNPTEPATCTPLSLQQQIWMASIGNVITDVVILVLPIPVVWALKLSMAQKWALVGLFSLGFFTCLLSCMRLIFTIEPSDFTYGGVTIQAWSTAEVASGIICGAIPTLRPLVGRYFKGFRTHNASYASWGGRYGSKGVAPDGSGAKSTLASSRNTKLFAANDLDLEMELQKPYQARARDGDKDRAFDFPPGTTRFQYSVSAGKADWKTASETRIVDSQSSSSSEIYIEGHTTNERRPSMEIRIEKQWSVDDQRK
ncbi:hypothetical protein BX600DRAFT_434758 [Xylariales sp. PMI_506]|nr:hypothetical protein BX600DRAFT_434758 [Xylariales sp. PMI_506]